MTEIAVPNDANEDAPAVPGVDATVRVELEQPPADSVIHCGEMLVGYGWAMAATRISAIEVDLDGERLCSADIGLPRPDRPDGTGAGFAFAVALPPRANGPAALRLTIVTGAGERRVVQPVEIAGGSDRAPPGDATPPPPPALEPIRVALEEARVDPAGVLHVRGWAIAARDVRGVEVFFGERSLGFADIGLSRLDVAGAFPDYKRAGLGGFALTVPLPPGLDAADMVTAVVIDGAGDMLSASKEATEQPDGATPAAPPARPAPMLVTLEETRISELGVLTVRGWAASLSPVEQVRVFHGTQQIGIAAHDLPRDDVGRAHPAYPNAATAGFLLRRDVADEMLAGQTLRVEVSAFGGISRTVTGTVVAAPPIHRPEQVAREIQFHCDAISLDEDGSFHVKGWALCPSGTAAIDIDLDEEMLGQARLGEERPDVAHHHPLLPGAHIAGFHFQGSAAQRCRGEHFARLTVRGHDGESRVVTLPVLARPVLARPLPAETGPQPAPATPPAASAGLRFYLDTPALRDGHATETVRGFLTIGGWAFSSAGITGIEVFVDGRSQGQAYRGIRREDLRKTFPQPEALRSGFAMLVPPQLLKRGRHTVRVVIRDGAGQAEAVAFTLDAEPGTEGPGPWSPRHKITEAEGDLGRALLAATGVAPAWTLVMPPGGTTAAQARRLRATIETLRHQVHPGWTLVLPVPDAAARDAMLARLAEEARELHGQFRVVVAHPDTPLAGLAAGADGPRLLGLLSPGDVLGEDALLELSLVAAETEGADFLYGDERRIDPADGTLRAFFKPDWSPDLLLSTNYIGRPWAATPELLARAGVTLGDLERHGDYDTVLRLTELAARIVHVPRVLGTRAARALDTPAEERRALTRALARRSIAATVMPGCIAGTWRVRRARTGEPLVSIIIPTVATRGLVRTAIESIRDRTAYRNFEIVCIDNIQQGASAEGDGWKLWLGEHADTVVRIVEPFNWSRFNNIGARAARGDVLLFLNDDIEVTDAGWLDGMLEHALRPEVGAVGPQLLYPDGKVQHAGMFLSDGVGRHAFRFLARDEPGPFGLALTQRNVISVTGACLMTGRDTFEALGGFDEEHSVINNDLDFCLRANASGRVVVFTPHASLIHHEMVSRGEITDSFNADRFQGAWKNLFRTGDPYFNPNLSGDYDDYVPDEEPVRARLIGHPVIARERVRRILAVKLDHIGDFVSAFPAFRRLKERFPNAELTVLAAEASLALAPLEPAIDRVIRFDFFHARSEMGQRTVGRKEMQRLRDELAPFRFDLALDLRRQPETREVLQHTGARWLAGFDTENRTEWLDIAVEWEGDVARTHKRTHISEALVQFVDAVAVACETDRRIIPGRSRRAAARPALAARPEVAGLGLEAAGRPLVCVHPGAGAENKEWPLANFAGLIDLLSGRHDAAVVIIGGPGEVATADRLIGLLGAGARVASLAGAVGLRNLPEVLAACDLYVGNDSGPKHLAASLGVPTVAIHSGSVDPVEWGPLGPAAVAVHRAMTCSPCYLAKAADCHRGLACLAGVRVGDVYRQCRRLLALARAPADATSAGGNGP